MKLTIQIEKNEMLFAVTLQSETKSQKRNHKLK